MAIHSWHNHIPPPHSIFRVRSEMHLNKQAVNEEIGFIQFSDRAFHKTDEQMPNK
jgi:hypothetical protein